MNAHHYLRDACFQYNLAEVVKMLGLTDPKYGSFFDANGNLMTSLNVLRRQFNKVFRKFTKSVMNYFKLPFANAPPKMNNVDLNTANTIIQHYKDMFTTQTSPRIYTNLNQQPIVS